MLAETTWEKLEIAWGKWITIANVSEVKTVTGLRRCRVNCGNSLSIFLFLALNRTFSTMLALRMSYIDLADYPSGLQLIKLYRRIRLNLTHAKSRISIVTFHPFSISPYYLPLVRARLFSLLFYEKWRIKTSELHCGLLKRGRNIIPTTYTFVDLYRELLKSFYYVKPISSRGYISPSRRRRGVNSTVANATSLALVMYSSRVARKREERGVDLDASDNASRVRAVRHAQPQIQTTMLFGFRPAFVRLLLAHGENVRITQVKPYARHESGAAVISNRDLFRTEARTIRMVIHEQRHCLDCLADVIYIYI